MSRWHAPSCSNPRVVVQQQRPYCESCDSHPDIDALVAAQAAKPSPIPYLPPDEPPGQMHLWWPPCVPYVTKGPDGHPVPVQPPEDDMPTSTPDEDESSWNACNRHIYPQRLKEDEFRVMCLYPIEEVNAPIHVTLEVYDDLRYHEYETVSYTWGGENGDSRLTQPVYVGPFWDILIQTHNCWEMLRHMRPWKGVRTIWVDAICINQTDMQERQKQVAKMGRIYEKASRLVIYLGPDLAPPTSISSPYPRRHHLEELDTLTKRPKLPPASSSSLKQCMLADVLNRNYFRRLWIIQELIMSTNITLRIGDIEFLVDQLISSQTVQACNIPWFTSITRKVIGDAAPGQLTATSQLPYSSGSDLRTAVELADASRASDPRDKIFGILGLIDLGDHRVDAAYSISFRHLVIGYYAYCLLTRKDLKVLAKASGLRAPEGMPSWAPPAQYDASRNEYVIPKTSEPPHDQWLDTTSNFGDAYSGDHTGDEFHTPCLAVAYQWRPSGWLHESSKFCWHSHATIDSSTGGISLTALHIMSFGSINFSEAKVDWNGENFTHTLKAGTSTIHLIANESILGPADDPSKVHLFVLCDYTDMDTFHNAYIPGLTTDARLCLLQETNDDAKFRLLSACVTACFHVPLTPEDLFNPCNPVIRFSPFYLEHYRVGSNVFSAYSDKNTLPLPLLRPDCPTVTHFHQAAVDYITLKKDITHLDIYPVQPIDDAQRLWEALESDPESYMWFFESIAPFLVRFPSPRLALPGITNSAILFQVFQSILDAERSGSSEGFFNVYFQAVQDFHPQLIQWQTRRNSTANDLSHREVGVINLVQLRFEPDQYHLLENILDWIQEDVKDGMRSLHAADRNAPPVDISQGQWNPPFLRIGWRDLSLGGRNLATEDCGPGEGDNYGFYPLDAIHEVIHQAKATLRSSHGKDGIGEEITGGKLSENAAMDEEAASGGSKNEANAERLTWKKLGLEPNRILGNRRNHSKQKVWTNLSMNFEVLHKGWSVYCKERYKHPYWSSHRNKRAYDDSVVRNHKNQTIWVAFDLLSLTLWAQTHEYMANLRSLSQFCKDGENELTRLLKPSTDKEKATTRLNWPPQIMKDFNIDGEFRSITII